jgi:phenylalanyl-tRNA synthetase alpha subunit
MEKEILISNLDKLHTTELGLKRIKENLGLNTNNIVTWCKQSINSPSSLITKKGKNWYVRTNHYQITINSSSYTIITAHPCINTLKTKTAFFATGVDS